MENALNAMTWTVDTAEGTLEGKGTLSSSTGHPWDSYLKEIKTVYLKDEVRLSMLEKSQIPANTYQNVVFHKDLGNGFSWKYDMNTTILTLSGKGVYPEDFQLSLSNEEVVEQCIISDGITGFNENTGGFSRWFGKVAKIGKDVKSLPIGLRNTKVAYEVDSANPYLSSYDQCLYSKNYGTLFAVPEEKTSIKFHEKVRIIGNNAFSRCEIDKVIVPWGITTIEDSAFSGSDCLVILPDTLSIVPTDIGWAGKSSYVKIYYSKNNTAVANAIAKGIKEGRSQWDVIAEKVDTVYPYYGLTPEKPTPPTEKPTPPTEKPASEAWMKQNGKWYYYRDGSMVKGWLVEDKATKKTKNLGLSDAMTPAAQSRTYLLDPKTGAMVTGLYRNTAINKAYFFDSSGLMQHSKWQYTNGNWYYLNAYGAVAVKHWAKSGGKWFYLKDDGKMATNQWVEWYKKWYYVGSDGAMYVNRKTPDGSFVNGDGVKIMNQIK